MYYIKSVEKYFNWHIHPIKYFSSCDRFLEIDFHNLGKFCLKDIILKGKGQQQFILKSRKVQVCIFVKEPSI